MSAEAPKQRLHYKVTIPGLIDRFKASYSEARAISESIMSAMKDRSALWYVDTEYLHDAGARRLIDRILNEPNWERYVQLVGPDGKPLEVDLTPEKKPEQQLELNIGGTTRLKQWTDEEAYQVLSSQEAVPAGRAEMSVTWPSTGRKITYTSDSDQRQHLVAIIEKAKEKKASVVLRMHELSEAPVAVAITDDQRVTRQIHDGIMWRKGKVSVKAIEQFRRHATPEVQTAVDKLIAHKKLAEAIDLIRPYMAYQVQAAGEGAQAKVVAVDFDGVLAKHDPENNTMQQEPIEGAIEALNYLVDNGYEVTIFSCRANKEEGQNEIKDWLQRFGGPDLPVTGGKPSADAYVDDKAIKFHHWEDAMEKVKNQKKLSTLICEEDGTVMSLASNKQSYICPACDSKKTLGEASILTIYAFSPGDLVHVKSVEGTTLGDAYLLYKASVLEERALKATNLWMVKFVAGECLPVSEQYLMKTGFDNEKRLEAESVMLGEALIEPEEDTTLKYDLDKVIEATLQEVQEGILPADAILVAMASRYTLSAEDLDTLAEHVAELDKVEEEVIPVKVDLVAAAADAIEEADAFFEDAKTVPSEEDEQTLVIGYLAEEFGWTEELVDHAMENRVKEVIAQVREASKQTPRWITAKDKDTWEEAKKKAGEGGINGTLAVFRTMKLASSYMELNEIKDRNEEITDPDMVSALSTDDLQQMIKYPELFDLSQYEVENVREALRQMTGEASMKEGEVKEYGPVTTPSLTSVPESEYDVVRQQTVADIDNGIDETKLVIMPPDRVFIPNLARQTLEGKEELEEFIASEKSGPSNLAGTKGITLMYLSPEAMERIIGLFPHVMAEKVPLESMFSEKSQEPFPFTEGNKESKMNIKTAGTWSVPNTKAKAMALVSFLNELKNPMNGLYGVNSDLEKPLYNLMGDDDLFDQLEHAQKEFEGNVGTFVEGHTAASIIVKKLKEWLANFNPNNWSDKWDPEALSILKSYVSGTTAAMEHKHTCPYCSNQWACGNDPSTCTINPSWPCANCLKVKETKTSTLQKTLEGVRLDAESKRIVASIFEDIMLYEDQFLTQAGQFFTYEWDPGASWEVRDIAGKKQIVRKEPSKKEIKKTKHAFQQGQLLKYHAAFFPVEVKVTELLGDDRYKIKSTLDGNVYNVGEDELFLPEDGAAIFG